VAMVLLIEDELLVRNLYKTKLEMSSFDVETASDGLDGLEKARELKPDLILLDIIMPRLNGLDVLRKIKKDPWLKEIPVVMLTNLDGNKYKKECSEMGASGFIVKSIGTPNYVLREVRKLLC
jgi:two-component system, chemotaxis family, chemotaxis protein CheY